MADSATPYLYEFLWRGRPAGATESPTYHVILAREAPDGFGGTTTALSQAMTPDQAVAAGFPMPTILAGIDTALTAETTALRAANADLTSANAALAAEKTALEADKAALLAKLPADPTPTEEDAAAS